MLPQPERTISGCKVAPRDHLRPLVRMYQYRRSFLPTGTHCISNAARSILAVTFLLVAALLHLTLCEWGLRWPDSGPEARQMITMEWNDEIVGLWTSRHVTCDAGFVFGLAAPILLIGISIALHVENRKQNRHGTCARCRYSLIGLPDGICPECGLKSDSKRSALDA